MSRRTLMPVLIFVAAMIFAASPAQARLVEATASWRGGDPNGRTFTHDVSRDGRYVVFESAATNLVRNDTNDRIDVFIRDVRRNATNRVSVTSNGYQAGRRSSTPSISADAKRVVFQSRARNLTPEHKPGVFLRDLVRRKTTLIRAHAEMPVISADGTHVAYALMKHDEEWPQVYVTDLATGKTRMASVDNDGRPGDDESLSPSISATGDRVAFTSEAELTHVRDAIGLYVHDFRTGRTIEAARNVDGRPMKAGLFWPGELSGDGRHFVFRAMDEAFDPDSHSSNTGIYLTDLARRRTYDVTHGLDLEAQSPTVSYSGRYVGWDALPGDGSAGQARVYWKDRRTGRLESYMSDDSSGSFIPHLDPTGAFFSFMSWMECPSGDPNDRSFDCERVFVKGPQFRH